MIKPSVGRVVWFYPHIDAGRNPNGQPHAALVAKVIDERTVNLAAYHSSGESYAVHHVRLVQDGDIVVDDNEARAEWMPYQKGQAAKAETQATPPVIVNVALAPSLAPSGPLGVQDIAQICHEVNGAYCASQGDHSQPLWDLAPDWQRQSAIAGVRYAIEHPDATPADSHNSWLAEKTRDGWTYGPVKDPVAKTHPCYVPYDQLPASQKAKDYIFLAIVRELAPALPVKVHDEQS